MTSLVHDLSTARAKSISITDDTLSMELSDARTLSVPLMWFPRLQHGSPIERANWRLVGSGEGIHWPDLEEDISIASLLEGRPSMENPTSFEKWLKARAVAHS